MDLSNFTITKQSDAPDIKFEVAGYIVYDTAGLFEQELGNSFKDGPKSITIDMENVVVFTSIGIRVILKTYKTAMEKKVEFHIENPSDIVRSVLKLSKLEEMLVK